MPAAWLIDQWGFPRPVAENTLVGRSQAEADMAILHPSISTEHARIERVEFHADGGGDGTWRVTDLDSLNGTFHNGQRVGMAILKPGDRLAFGDVNFFFTDSSVPDIPGTDGKGRTQRVGEKSVDAAVVLETLTGHELKIMHRIEGGLCRVGDAQVEFARLEFGLLQCLIERQRQHADPELRFVTWQELAKTLKFKSRAADSENVRELVRRVRRKLKSVGIPDLIESRQGVGYRLSGGVKSFG